MSFFQERREIKVKFVDFYLGHKPENIWYYKTLSKFYNVRLSDDPDYLFDGGDGHEHYNSRYDRCVKIVSIGENYAPDFNLFDYAIGFDDIQFGDRYLRHPLFAIYDEFAKLSERKIPDDETLLNRDFCSFVVSDARGDPCRIEFFKALSQYKHVASGGAILNNVGGRVADKNAFCAKFKFNIAFENSICPGYTTEKVMQPLAVNSVPIYYGNPDVAADFRPECMILLKSRTDMAQAIEEVKYLDSHDDAYLAKCHASCMVHPFEWYEDRLASFLRHIIDQPLDQAKRLVVYGNQVKYRARYARLHKIDDLWRVPLLKLYQLRFNLIRWH